MFSLPDTVPWWAVLIISIFVGFIVLVRGMWPQNSNHRKELLQGWQRERARRRKERQLERTRRRQERQRERARQRRALDRPK